MTNSNKKYKFNLKDNTFGNYLKTFSGITSSLNNINDAAKLLSNSFTVLSAAKKMICAPYRINNFIKISQIPNLNIPKINYIAEEICGFQDRIKQFYIKYDEICSILAKYNYLLPLTLPINIYSNLLEYLKNANNKNDKEKEINKLLLKLFSHNNWEMATEIISGLYKNSKINPKRIVILEDCIKVLKHNSRKVASNTILPVLIAQIEGIWVDILGHNLKKEKLKNIVKAMKNNKYANPARELLADVLFQYTKTELPVKPDFCRNKILHGEEVEYGSIYNIIRAFLIIEFLNYIKADNEIEEK